MKHLSKNDFIGVIVNGDRVNIVGEHGVIVKGNYGHEEMLFRQSTKNDFISLYELNIHTPPNMKHIRSAVRFGRHKLIALSHKEIHQLNAYVSKKVKQIKSHEKESSQ